MPLGSDRSLGAKRDLKSNHKGGLRSALGQHGGPLSGMEISKRIAARLALALPLLVTGCDNGPQTYPAGGTVKYRDGTPLAGGRLVFQLEGAALAPTARGMIGPEGEFQLSTFGKADGALPGEHRVMIVPPAVPQAEGLEEQFLTSGKGRPAQLSTGPQLHPRYRSFKSSGLSFTVTKSGKENQFQIVVEQR